MGMEQEKRRQKWKLGYRLLSMLLSLVLVLELVPGSVWAAEDGGTDLSSGAAETTGIEVAEGEASEKVLGEVDGLREESQKHFRMADGSFIAVDYGVPVHFSAGSDEQGETIWEDIDNTMLLQPQEAQAAFSVLGENAASTYAAAGQNAALSNSNEAAASYAAVNGDDTKVFAGNLATGFLFSTQRGQTGARMSLVDGEAAQPEAPAATEAETTENTEETIVSPTEAEVPSAELEASGETGAAESTTEPEMTEAAENDRAALAEQATGKETANADPAGVSPAQAGNEEAAKGQNDASAENGEDSFTGEAAQKIPGGKEEPENSAYQKDESASDNTDTQPAETVPATEATEPAAERIAYNRSAVAQISYPDRETDRPMRVGAAKPAENAPSLEAQITPTRLRAQVRYEEVYPGVDLLYELYSYNVKETILVKKPLESYSFSFRLDLQGLTPAMQEDGSILLLDGENAPVYEIPAPYMADESGAYSEAAFYTLTQAEDSWLLTVTADADWMNAPARAFPVAIDPTIIDKVTTGSDTLTATYVTQGAPTVTHPGYQNLYLGYGGQSTVKEEQVFLGWDKLPTVPAGSVVVGAQVSLYMWDYDYYGGASEIQLLAEEVTAAKPGNYTTYHSWIQSLCWNTRPTRSSTVIDYVTASDKEEKSYLSWNLTSAVTNWYHSGKCAGAVGIRLRNPGNYSASKAAAAKLYGYSSNHGLFFFVSYRNVNGLEPYYSYQGLGAGNAGSAYVSDYTGQLTLVKELASYASTVNPFSLQMVYNSSYFQKDTNANYDCGMSMGLGMHMGSGIQLNVMQRIVKEELQNDGESDKKTTYLKYTDGDGTVHYFAKDASKNDGYYYDEDGLGLKIKEYQTGCFDMTDDKDNISRFINGHLSSIKDANGNEIQIHYIHSDGTVSANGAPNASGDRISKIVQKNNGASAITVATFAYTALVQWQNCLNTITDAAGNVYKFEYMNYKLWSVKRNGTVIMQFGLKYDSSLDVFVNQVDRVFDPEAQYGIAFTYNAGKVGSYYEITSASNASKPGAIVEVSHLESGQTCYRDYGKDRTRGNDAKPTGDDILTFYTFDYAGRTVNAYTTNEAKEILGASNAVYSGIGSTDKANNRTLRTASIGVAGMNVLRDFGFDRPEVFWTYQGANGSGTHILSKEENPRTGTKACKGWIQAGKTDTIAAYRSTDQLQPGTYTLSAYVSTAQCTNFAGEGVYLQVSGNGVSAKSEAVNYQTSASVDGGWVRLAVTFTVETAGKYTIGVYNSGAGPYFFADDFQLEKNNAPSNLNLLENGSMQYWGHGWTMGSLASFHDNNNAYSIKINGDAYTESCAYQDVPISQTGQTYVLSGWAKADSVPDNKQTATGDDGAARDKQKQFGLRAILTYADNSTEYHYVPFNPDVKDWQYASLAIVPKKANTQVKTIRVVCAYERNCNTTYFDNISLVREAAQTMKYDKDGNLVSVKTTGNAEETSAYANGNLMKAVTGGNGAFDYTYDSKHNVTSVTNGLQKEAITYDTAGNATGFTLTKKDGTGSKITASSTYSSDKNRVSSVTDARGNSTSYEYGSDFSLMTGAATKTTGANGTQVYTSYDTDKGRMDKTWISNVVVLDNVYNDQGRLESLARGGYIPDGARTEQFYNFTYDAFGNTTAISVGDRQLASYVYAAKNGLLNRQNYGNGAYTAFTYDDLGRTTQTKTSSGDVYDYTYTGDGQLYSLRDNNGTSSTADDIFYRYQYDTLGRLIHSAQWKNGETQLRASYQYDDSNRVKSFSYSIPGLIDSVTQSYYYNSNATDTIPDGALEKMALFSNAWLAYTYDTLGRLNQRKVGNILQENYTYLAGSGSNATTTMVSGLEVKDVTGSTKLKSYTYAYDKLGNITQIKDTVSNDTINYTYDAQGQLLSHNNPDATHTEYTYDTYGNIRSKNTYTPLGDLWDGYTYTYGDAQWKDLLTKLTVTHNGKSTSGTFTYDQIGNPLTYFNGSNWTFTWRNGRQLATAKSGTKTTKYEYNADGLRTRKTNADGTSVDYLIVNGQTVVERWNYANGSEYFTMRYTFDETGSVIGFSTRYPNFTDGYWEDYLFAKNLQGDVVAMYLITVEPPRLIATYEYDEWGKVTAVRDANGSYITEPAHLANRNPFRYRSYHYDTETGFYYLQSRYYDPVISRFINADSFASTGQDFIGCNMFVYCANNPINADDQTGCFLERLITGTVGALVGSGISALTTWITGGTPEEIAQAAKRGAFEGAITGIFPEAKVFINVTDSIVTFLDLWSHGTSLLGSFSCGLLSFGASCVAGNTGDKLTDTVVDNTFGFGASLISAVGERAAQKEKAPSPGLPGNYDYPYVNKRTENAPAVGYGHWVKCYW